MTKQNTAQRTSKRPIASTAAGDLFADRDTTTTARARRGILAIVPAAPPPARHAQRTKQATKRTKSQAPVRKSSAAPVIEPQSPPLELATARTFDLSRAIVDAAGKEARQITLREPDLAAAMTMERHTAEADRLAALVAALAGLPEHQARRLAAEDLATIERWLWTFCDTGTPEAAAAALVPAIPAASRHQAEPSQPSNLATVLTPNLPAVPALGVSISPTRPAHALASRRVWPTFADRIAKVVATGIRIAAHTAGVLSLRIAAPAAPSSMASPTPARRPPPPQMPVADVFPPAGAEDAAELTPPSKDPFNAWNARAGDDLRAEAIGRPLNPVTAEAAAAGFAAWLVESRRIPRELSVDDLWFYASEEFASLNGYIMPTRPTFLGELQKQPGVIVIYDRRVNGRDGKPIRKTTFYQLPEAMAVASPAARPQLLRVA